MICKFIAGLSIIKLVFSLQFTFYSFKKYKEIIFNVF